MAIQDLCKFTSSGTYSQILYTFSREIVTDNTSFSLSCELILNLYWLGYVQRVPSELKKVLKMLKLISCWDIYYFCHDYKHLPFSNKP